MNGEMFAYFHGNRDPNSQETLKIIRGLTLNSAVLGAFSLSLHVSN